MAVFETQIYKRNGFIALNLELLTKEDMFQLKVSPPERGRMRESHPDGRHDIAPRLPPRRILCKRSVHGLTRVISKTSFSSDYLYSINISGIRGCLGRFFFSLFYWFRIEYYFGYSILSVKVPELNASLLLIDSC